MLDCAGPEFWGKVGLEKQCDGRLSEATYGIFSWANAVVFVDGADLMVDEVKL